MSAVSPNLIIVLGNRSRNPNNIRFLKSIFTDPSLGYLTSEALKGECYHSWHRAMPVMALVAFRTADHNCNSDFPSRLKASLVREHSLAHGGLNMTDAFKEL